MELQTGHFLNEFGHIFTARARLGVLAACGAGLAGMAGIQAPGYMRTSAVNHPGSSTTAILNSSHGSSVNMNASGSGSGSGGRDSSTKPSTATPSEMDAFLRQAQRNGRSHIRTLGTLAGANLFCWLPLYIYAVIAPGNFPLF